MRAKPSEVIAWLNTQALNQNYVNYYYRECLIDFVQTDYSNLNITVNVHMVGCNPSEATLDGYELYYLNVLYKSSEREVHDLKIRLTKFWLVNPEFEPHYNYITIRKPVDYSERINLKGLRMYHRLDLALGDLIKDFNDDELYECCRLIRTRITQLAKEVEQEAPNREKYLLELEAQLNA